MHLLLLSLAGCVKTASGPDTEPADTAGVALADLDPDTLPQGTSPCRAPELVYVHTAIDGDTVHVDTTQGEESIRLIGVDTPEVGWGGDPSDCYGLEAQAFAQDALEGSEVWLTFDSACTDLYDRTLAYIHQGSGEQDFFQRRLLRGGYGRDFPWEGTDTFQDTFSQDAWYAQSNGEGLWGLCD